MLAGIKAEADARGARRIVFDAVDALLSLLNDPLAERPYRLDDWLSESGLTGWVGVQLPDVDTLQVGTLQGER